jgi:hypothetical protein
VLLASLNETIQDRMVDPEITAAIASGKVPSDITTAYLMESRDNASIAGILFVAILAVLTVTARVYARVVKAPAFGLDDILTIFTTVRGHNNASLLLKGINDFSSPSCGQVDLQFSNRLSTSPLSASV